MSGVARQPLRFQLGARTLFSLDRQLVRVALSLEEALAEAPPGLPPLPPEADGYSLTSVPRAWQGALAQAGLIAFERQTYTRHYVTLGQGEAAFLAGLSASARSAIRRKARRLAEAGGVVRAFHTPEALAEFHALALPLARRTYQARLLGSALPEGPAFARQMQAEAAAGRVRAWLMLLEGVPIAYLYCGAQGQTLRYDYVGHDPASAAHSPGAVLLFQALCALSAEPHFTRFDFTEGDGQHKRQFASGGVACADVLLLRPTLANRAALAALGGFDRAMARGKAAVTRLGLERIARRLRR